MDIRCGARNTSGKVIYFRFVRNMKISCSEDLLIIHNFDTSVSHIVMGLFTNCDI